MTDGPWDFQFKRDFQPGSTDANSYVLHATTCNALAVHAGKVWGGISYMSEESRRDRNALILLKPAADAPWQQDVAFGRDYVRVAALKSVTFETDHTGTTLAPPVSLLVAGDWQMTIPRSVGAWSRDDDTGTWHRETLRRLTRRARDPRGDSNRNNPEVRAFFTHRDRVTGIHHVFALASVGAIFRGAYDPAVPGRISWNKEPELDGMVGRPMAGAVANGVAYVPFGVRPYDPRAELGGLYRRIDGPKPHWERIEIRSGAIPKPRRTSVGSPRCGRSPPSGTALSSARGIGYNDMPTFTHPDTGEDVQLIGLFAGHPDREGSELGNSSWFLVRHGDGSYTHGRVMDPADPAKSAPIGLRGTRSTVRSPFPDHAGRVFYFGGFDEVNFRARGDRAWIYEATLPAFRDAKERPREREAREETR